MRRFLFIVLASLFIFVPLVTSDATRAYPTLPDSISSPSFGYVIHYDDDDPVDTDYMPAAQAQRMLDACNNSNTATVGNPNGLHVGYTNLGFLAPDFLGSTRNLYTWACTNCDSGDAPSDAIRLPATSYVSSGEQCIRSVVGHELFHHVQFAYITFDKWPNWAHPLEGTARMLQDKIYTDLDAWNAAGCGGGYVGETNGFLANPNRDIWNLTYPSALWWTYLSEQLGTSSAEPIAGADFLESLWARAQVNNDPPDVVKAVREAIAQFTSDSMESLFQDFTIANYTKQMDLSLLPNPPGFKYIDENDGNGLVFNAVSLNWSGAAPKSGNSSVVRWAARYLEADVSSCGVGVVGFRSEGDQAGYALVAIKGTDDVQGIYKGTSDNYARAVIQTSVNPYTKLGVVVTGGNSAANLNYTFDCGPVQMTIREPLYPEPLAYVGAYDAPERFLIKLRVQGPASLGTPSVEGLDTDEFTVFVGDPSDPDNEAPVVSGSYVQGEYWLVAQAPEKASPDPDTYNLTVKLGAISTASKEASVVYAVKSIDQMLVIDKSGSMDYPAGNTKIEAAKNAGMLFVDSARSSDYTGVVSFSGNNSETDDDAVLEYKLQEVTPETREEAKKAINGIETFNMTSIGDGMYKAYFELVNAGRPVPPVERWIVLLSDGMENEARFWADVSNYIHNNHIKVIAIALGPLSDQPLMQSIAADTDGQYYYVDLPPTRAVGDFALDLSQVYALSAERIQTHERLWETRGLLSSGANVELLIEVQEGGINDPLYTLAWSGGSMRNYAIYDPHGTRIEDLSGVEINRGDYHATFRLPYLNPGKWTIQLTADTGLNYTASLSGINRYGAQLRLFFGGYGGVLDGLSTNQFLVNQPIPIIASLTDKKGPLLGATITATVEHPDGTSMVLPLYDDGSHYDSFEGDGIYGGLYYRTTEGSKTRQNDTYYEKRGSYNVILHAEGRDNKGEQFQRFVRGSFSVIEPLEPGGQFSDSDKDGLSNLYENNFYCLDYLVADSEQDPDFDEMISLNEFNFGTNPCNPDTDGGGESDTSEIKRNSDPLDGSDDALPVPIDVGVISQVSNDLGDPGLRANANLIRYPASATYRSFLLFRRFSLSDPYVLVDEFDAKSNGGLYYDIGLTPGVRTYYRLVGVNSDGAISAPSGEFSGVPRANPIPPVGGISINNHAVIVTSTRVRLNLPLDIPFLITEADQGIYRATIQMMISNDPLFTGSVWLTYNPEPDWGLNPDENGHAIVYVKFRDAEGNESEVYHAEVDVLPSSMVGSIHLKVLLDEDLITRSLITQAGILVMPEGDVGLPPVITGADGYATLLNLLPGSYSLFIQFNGYIPITIEDINVFGGATVELGTFILTHWHTYMPVVSR